MLFNASLFFGSPNHKMPMKLSESRPYRPYECATLESPLCHLLVEHGGFLLRNIYRLRWFLTRPLQLPLLPCLPVVDWPILRKLPYVTVGQFILISPLIAIFLISFEATFMDPTKTSGHMATYAMLATFLLANKSNSILSFLFGLSYERLVPMHNMAALLTLLLSCFHARVAYDNTVKYGAEEEEDDELEFGGNRHLGGGGEGTGAGQKPSGNLFRPRHGDTEDQDNFVEVVDETTIWEFLWDGSINVTGTLALLCIALLVGFSVFRVFRKLSFDFWLITHIALSLFAVAFCLAHKGYNIMFALIWWAVDWLVRKIVMATFRFPRKATIREMPSGDLVELRMEHFSFRAGQFIRIAIPELGTLFFHPFTISSAPSDPEVVVHIKAMGDWTRRLLELSSRRDAVEVLIEGPYGGMSMDLDNDKRYPIVVCLAGGIGVTPCRSIARQLLHDHHRGRNLIKVQVVWAVRDLSLAKDLPILPRQGNKSLQHGNASSNTISMDESDCGISVDQFMDEEEVGSTTSESSPDAATDTSSSSKLHTAIFLTKSGDGARAVDSILPWNNCTFQQGRPDVSKILADLSKLAAGKSVSRVAVICCGPNALVDQVKKACRTQSASSCFGGGSGGVSFDLHEEVFDY